MSIKSNIPIDIFFRGVYKFSSPLEKMKEALAENPNYVIKQGNTVIHEPNSGSTSYEGDESYEDVVGYDF